MLLAIDVGNTNTVFALHDGARFVAEWRISTEGRRTADQYAVWLDQLMTLGGWRRRDVTGVVVANVAPQTMFNLRTLCEKYFGLPPMVVGEAGCDIGVQVKLDHPSEVGADRLVNAVAGVERYGPNLVIVDFGTATTFDVVDHEGAYVGGVIAPGVNLSMEALYRAAAKLPRISVEPPPQVVGTDTLTAMQSGIYWGYVSLIEGVLARIDAERGVAMTVAATGGLSVLFAKGTAVIQHVDTELTMRGLAHIYYRNSG